VLEHIEKKRRGAPELFFYPSGTFGPEQADWLVRKAGRGWSNNG